MMKVFKIITLFVFLLTSVTVLAASVPSLNLDEFRKKWLEKINEIAVENDSYIEKEINDFTRIYITDKKENVWSDIERLYLKNFIVAKIYSNYDNTFFWDNENNKNKAINELLRRLLDENCTNDKWSDNVKRILKSANEKIKTQYRTRFKESKLLYPQRRSKSKKSPEADYRFFLSNKLEGQIN